MLPEGFCYIYDAYGDLLRVTDPSGNQIVNTYDIRGNKLTSADPDMGSWSYVYDALGELTGQTDAKSQATALAYDALGRVTTRTEPDQTSTWTYDTAAHGVGAIKAATGSNASYERDYFYDAQERPSQLKLRVNGQNYLYIPTYNSDSRIDTLTYPSGLVVKYVYTALGYLQQLKDNATGAVLWTANARDAEMHLTDQSAGNNTHTLSVFDSNTGLVQQILASSSGGTGGDVANFGYIFDTIGNLSNRLDTVKSYAENFCYDGLNRLTAYSVGGLSSTDCHSGATGLVKTAAYNDIGNLTNKSDLAAGGTGHYGYPAAGSALPHAVMSISGTVNGVVNPRYSYDANGNMTCEYTGANCTGGGVIRDTETYWASNMPNTLTQGTASVAFIYDSEHARVTQAVANGSSTVTTTYLNDPITGAMSEKVSSGGTPTWNDYLMADGKLLGERSCTGTAPCSTGATTEYFVLDHLGSVAVVTDGASGAVTARESFDAWGRQRNPDGTDDATCALGSFSPNTRRFTSQEHIDTMCLINLNARIYDPTIGRFMVADSVVPDPYDGQSYNRYTYTDNRPLSFTDPTGHDNNVPWCLGSCINPNMTVSGGFNITETDFGDLRRSQFTLTYNSDGEIAAALNKIGDGDQGVMGERGATEEASQPEASASAPLNTSSYNNAQQTSDKAPDPVETVVVTGERKPSASNQYNVIIIDVRLPGPGERHAVKFLLDHRSINGGAFVQHVHSYVRNPDGSTRRVKDFSEEWDVPADSRQSERSRNTGQDDQYGVLNSGGATGALVIHGEVQYFDGVKLTAPEWKVGNEPDLGEIPSKQGAPGLPLENASQPAVRNVTIPF